MYGIVRLLFLIFIVLSGSSASSQDGFCRLTDKENEIKRVEISKAKVRKVSMKIFEYKKKTECFEEEGRPVQEKVYNEGGYLTEKTSWFINAGKSELYRYDNKGRLIEVETQMPKGIFSGKYVYEFNDRGLLINGKQSGKNGKVIMICDYTYPGDKRTATTRDTTGKMQIREVVRIVPDSSLEEILTYNRNDELFKTDVYEFDKQGRMKRWTVRNTAFNQFGITDYQYENGQLTGIRYLDINEKIKRYRKNKYDDKNMLIESTMYDPDGTPKNKEVYLYEYY
ncbi:MAG: hypothetical protein KJ607_07230 [Bacteroidetes bacterium]|nr:hypothetical protein [Bacteroidota bacterium]